MCRTQTKGPGPAAPHRAAVRISGSAAATATAVTTATADWDRDELFEPPGQALLESHNGSITHRKTVRAEYAHMETTVCGARVTSQNS
jgi:hypothetical protein